MAKHDERIREVVEYLAYDPELGHLTWAKPRPNQRRAFVRAGKLMSNGYRYVKFKGKLLAEHRIAYFMATGEFPDAIDHINRIPADNRIANLRGVTAAENLQNISTYKTNSSGHVGVSYVKSRGAYKAGIHHARKYYYLGCFPDAEEAARAYREAAIRLRGELAADFLRKAAP